MSLLRSFTSHDAAKADRGPQRDRRGELFGTAITPAELDRTALLFAMLFLAALVLVVGRSARDALLLTHLSVAWIAPVWMAYAVVSAAVAASFAAWHAKIARDRFIVVFALAAAVSYAGLRVLVGLDVSAAYVVFAVWSEVVANFAAVLVWAIAQDLHDARSAKRLFGLIGAGRVFGVAVGGFLTGGVVQLIGTRNLIVVLAGALVALALLARVLAARHPLPRTARAAEDIALARLPRPPLYKSRYVVGLAVSTTLLFAALTIGDFQFKAIARSAYPNADELASFLGIFHGAVGLGGVLVQVAITPRLLTHLGVAAGLATLPVAFVATTVALWIHPSLAIAVALKAADNGLQYSVHEATVQLLLFPFADATRERARALIDAAMKPLGCGIGAIVLWLVAPATPPGPLLVRGAADLGLWTVPLGALLLTLVPAVRQGYLRAMRRSLTRRELNGSDGEPGPRAHAMLLEALEATEAQVVIFAMSRLREMDPDALGRALPRLCKHPAAPVRARALRLVIELVPPDADVLARAGVSDPDPDVRKAAVYALSELLQEDAHDELTVLADREDDVAVRTAAIAALLRRCGLDGMLDGAPRLAAMLGGPAAERAAAAHVLELIGSASLERALARLLADEDATVRRAAVQAAANVRDPRIVDPLVALLAERGLAPLAARALSALGVAAVPGLHRYLADPSTPRPARLWIPRVLFRTESLEALDALVANVDEPDEEVRQKVLASASRLRLALDAPPVDAAFVRARIEREIADHVAERDAYLAVRPLVLIPLCEDHLLARLRKSIVRMLRLCELSYPRQVVASVRAHLFGTDPNLRANALEVLESLLDRTMRARMTDVVGRCLALFAGDFPAPPAPPDPATAARWLGREIASPSPFRAALALEAAAARTVVPALEHATAALSHPHPLVREAAVAAVAALSPETARDRVAPLVRDPDRVVAARAEHALATGAPERTMYGTIEKVIFLQHVPVFAKVAGDDLVDLARNSQVVPFDAGEVIFRQGDPGGALYFVISGAVSLAVDRREVARLGPGDVFGEMSIFDREPRATTATVVERAELLRVSAEDFQEAVRETVEIAEAVIVVLNRRLREADRRLAAARSSRSSTTPTTPPATDTAEERDEATR